MKKRLLMLTAAFLCSLNAMSQQGSRLIGEGNYVYSGGSLSPKDTCTSSYTPGAYDPEEDEWIPNQCICGAYSMAGYYFTTRTTNTFTSQQQLESETGEIYDTAAGVWEFEYRDLYTYTASKKIATIEGQSYNGSWSTFLKWTYTYNAQDSVIDKALQYNTGSGLANYSWEVTHFNSSGQRDTSTTYLWDSGTMTWDPSSRTTYYYNTPKPIAQVLAQFSGSTWTETDSFINTLDANYNILTQLHKTFNGTTWVNSSNQINTYDANNNLLTAIAQAFIGGVFVNTFQTASVYNTFNQPTQTTVQSWDAATSTFTWQNGNTLDVMTYEAVATGIKGAVVKKDAMRLYPMPASDKLMVNLNWKEMPDAKVIMVDMSGKVAGMWSGPDAQQQVHTLDISNIPSGVYLLKVVGTEGVFSQKVSIVR